MAEITVSNGTKISLHDSGNGAAILFLHSFGHNKNMWFPQFMHFHKSGYRVIAPDMPGHGESSFDPAQHSVDLMAQHYIELVEQLGLKKTILAGISIGGYISLRMWAKRPDLISAMVLCCTKAEADSEEIKERRRAQIASIAANGLEHFIVTGAPKRLSPRTVTERPWVLDWIKMMNRTVSAEANSATLEAMALKADDTDTLKSIDVPALILSGADDKFIPSDAAGNLHAGIRNSVHRVIPDAGHVASLERPTIVNSLMEEFLASR